MNVSVDRPTINTSVSGAHSSENRIEKDTFPIPDDVIIEIFSRLSVKVIARCRCVSKLWGSILRSKDFTDFFLIKSSARPHLLFLCRRLDRILFLSSHPPQNPDENSSPIDTSYDTSFPLNISQICRPINGLTCVVYLRTHYKGRTETVHVICNLCTRQSVSLCKVETWKTGVRSYFGYDPIEKQYKVLCREDKVSAAVDENKEDSMIVCFDVRSEKFKVIQVAESFIGKARADLMNYNGKLGTIVCPTYGYVESFSTSLQLWVLEDADNQEWSKHEYMLPASWRSVFANISLSFAGVTRTNEFLLSPIYQDYGKPFYIFYYNIERNTIRSVQIEGMNAPYASVIDTLIDHVEDASVVVRA
ncbi:F-box protein [Raphanus sativus]|nr:F-box protein [Raphanus sativus]